MSAVSASGVMAEGNRIVRVAYTDESGISPNQTVLVQAAVIVHGDNQIVPIEDYLDELIVKHIPAESREGFVFHATDIYWPHDKKSIFYDHDVWPQERRWAILDDLVALPHKFIIPIAMGIIQKEDFRNQPEALNRKRQEVDIAAHALAIIQCEIGIELWMRKYTTGEITHIIIIAEDNAEVRLAAKQSHAMLKDSAKMEREGFKDHPCFPLRKIKDGLQFASKEDSWILQVADTCAWAIRLACRMSRDANRFFLPLRSQIFQLDGQLTAIWDRQLSETPARSP